jgi:hypothetical protein
VLPGGSVGEVPEGVVAFEVALAVASDHGQKPDVRVAHDGPDPWATTAAAAGDAPWWGSLPMKPKRGTLRTAAGDGLDRCGRNKPGALG